MPRPRQITAIKGGDTYGLDESMIRCRTYGHAWDEFYPSVKGPPSFGWRLSLRCTRCTTERHDTIDVLGHVAAREYLYPEGYHLLRDETPTRDQLRVAMFARVRARLAKVDAIGEMTEAS
jgi:hypothetical protein